MPKMLSFLFGQMRALFLYISGFGLWSRFVFPHPSCYLLSVIIASERNSFDIFNVLVVLYSYTLIFPQKRKASVSCKNIQNFKMNDKISVQKVVLRKQNGCVIPCFAYN